jgi:ABC-type multidrug transport system permease subunit
MGSSLTGVMGSSLTGVMGSSLIGVMGSSLTGVMTPRQNYNYEVRIFTRSILSTYTFPIKIKPFILDQSQGKVKGY